MPATQLSLAGLYNPTMRFLGLVQTPQKVQLLMALARARKFSGDGAEGAIVAVPNWSLETAADV